MVRYLQTGQKITICDICGKDTTGTGRDICYICEAETTPEIRELLRKQKAPKSTPNPYE